MTHPGRALSIVVLVVLAAGCVTLPGNGNGATLTESELEAQLEDAEPPSAATATLVTERAADGESETYTETIWMRDDGAFRSETADGAFRNVNDGERSWFYDVEADRVTVLDSNRTPDSHFDYLYDTQRQYFEELDVAAIEESTVDGRETYHVTFVPPRRDSVDSEITVLVGNTEFVVPLETSEADRPDDDVAEQIDVWIDRETLFPVKQRLEGDQMDRTWTYTDLSFGDDIDDERFEFEPPEDAVVEQGVHPYGQPVETIADAEAGTNLTVDEPTHLPGGLERDSIEIASYVFGDAMSATVRYADDDRRTILVSTTTVTRLPGGAGNPVSVGEKSATKIESEFGTRLEWPCDGQTTYVFATEEFDAETTLEVAESIECG